MIYLLDNIQNRACDLSYVSETDADVNAFIVGRNVQTLTPLEFARANRIEDEDTITEFAFAHFFSRLDDYKAATILRNFLEDNLGQRTMFKVGDIRRDVYAVGLFNGHIVGVKSFAVET